jgi:hypothetical protein
VYEIRIGFIAPLNFKVKITVIEVDFLDELGSVTFLMPDVCH